MVFNIRESVQHLPNRERQATQILVIKVQDYGIHVWMVPKDEITALQATGTSETVHGTVQLWLFATSLANFPETQALHELRVDKRIS